jgi:hypothetical protein
VVSLYISTVVWWYPRISNCFTRLTVYNVENEVLVVRDFFKVTVTCTYELYGKDWPYVGYSMYKTLQGGTY